MILSFGRSICGFRSGTQNLQRRPQPVVISTTPKVVRVSGKRIAFAIHRMFDFDASRQFFSLDRFAKELERVGRFAAPFDDAIDTQFFVSIGLNDLPATGTADDHFEILSITDWL